MVRGDVTIIIVEERFEGLKKIFEKFGIIYNERPIGNVLEGPNFTKVEIGYIKWDSRYEDVKEILDYLDETTTDNFVDYTGVFIKEDGCSSYLNDSVLFEELYNIDVYPLHEVSIDMGSYTDIKCLNCKFGYKNYKKGTMFCTYNLKFTDFEELFNDCEDFEEKEDNE
jgi:hypothetical protein